MKLDHYSFTRKQIARHKCVGCTTNVIQAGEYCMLKPDLWERELQLGWTDNMCIACIEARIGRKLKLTDFMSFPTVEGFPPSSSLLERFSVSARKPKRARKSKARRTPRRRVANAA